MAAFLNSELDFIFFFYGLAFLLLASICFAVGKVRGPGEFWMVLGSFAALHGIGEWLDLAALVLGDGTAFAICRTAVMTFSFVLLLEFVRLRVINGGMRLPGRWIYLPLLAVVLGVGLYGGLSSAQATARYLLGFTGASAAAIYCFNQGRSLKGGWRLWTRATAVCFALYAVAAGLIVPYAPFWPASVVNQASFADLTGLPIQLVRGVLACALAVAIWAIWGRLLAEDVASERYSNYLRKQFFVALGVLAAIILVGWVLTENLGRLYQVHIQEEARGDFDLLSSRVAAETTVSQAIAQTIAGTPVALSLLTAGTPADRDAVASLLALAVNAAQATEAAILNRNGAVVARNKTTALHAELDSELTRPGSGGGGTPSHRFALTPDGKPAFYASYPIRAADGAVVGAAVLKKTLEALEGDVRRFDMPYYLVDAGGRVMLTNRSDALHQQLWPATPDATVAGQSTLQSDVADGTWISLDGERQLVRRGYLDSSGWSLVMIAPTAEIYASRILGIVITLLVAITTLTFLVSREHRVRDGVQLDKRVQLQELARTLDLKAGTDPLTGIFNRRKFDVTFAAEIERAERYGAPLCLLMLDIDHFKRVNDVYGHVAGDMVLTSISQLIAANLRQSDVLARWGGEEFVVLVPGADRKMAGELAEKLRASIAGTPFGEAGTVTCSFGVVQYRPGDTTETMVNRVDRQLYRAKAAGRNRIEGEGAGVPDDRFTSAA